MAFALELLTIVTGATVLAVLIPRGVRRARSKPGRPTLPRPSDLERIERTLTARTAGEVHARLRPLFREIAKPLTWRHGVRLDQDPMRGRELLGRSVWELVRPDRPRPEDLRAPGLGQGELEEIVSRLEAL